MASQLLFNKSVLRDYLDDRIRNIRGHLSGITELSELERPELRDILTKKAAVEPITLRRDEARLNVSEPTSYQSAHEVALDIPFEGDGMLFDKRAASYSHNPPKAEVVQGPRSRGQKKYIAFRNLSNGAPTSDAVRAWAKAAADRLEVHLGYQDAELRNHEAQIRVEIESAIARRRDEISTLDNLNADLSKGGI